MQGERMRVAVARRRKSLRKSADTSAAGVHAAVAVALQTHPAAHNSPETSLLEPQVPRQPDEHNGPNANHDGAADESAELLRRAPSGYLWNQLYSFWTYLALLLQSLVITQALKPDEKGIYTLIERPAVFLVYVAALGLDSAAT